MRMSPESLAKFRPSLRGSEVGGKIRSDTNISLAPPYPPFPTNPPMTSGTEEGEEPSFLYPQPVTGQGLAVCF